MESLKSWHRIEPYLRKRTRYVVAIAILVSCLALLGYFANSENVRALVAVSFMSLAFLITYYLLDWAYAKERFVTAYPQTLYLFGWLGPLLAVLAVSIDPLFFSTFIFSLMMIPLLLDIVWIDSLRNEKNIFQTVILPRRIKPYTKAFLVLAAITFVLYYVGRMYVDETWQRSLLLTAAFYAMFALFGFTISLTPTAEDSWKYCRMSLKVVKKNMQNMQTRPTTELARLKRDLSVFKTVIELANALSLNYYQKLKAANPGYYYKALLVSCCGGTPDWRKRANEGIDAMLASFSKKGKSLDFDFYMFAKGLNIIAGRSDSFDDTVKAIEIPGEGQGWLSKNATLIELVLSTLVAVIAMLQLFIEPIKKFFGLP